MVFVLAGGTVGRAVPASRPSLPTVGADHRAAQRCGKTGQTSFATTVPNRDITARAAILRCGTRWGALDFAFVFSRAERVDESRALLLVQVKGAMDHPVYQVVVSVRLKVPWASHGRQFTKNSVTPPLLLHQSCLTLGLPHPYVKSPSAFIARLSSPPSARRA